VELDAVQVVGIRGSVQKSLDSKREAPAHVEVVSAEDIGKLPARNVADTLQRIAGINVSASGGSEGGFDESERVSMRGTAPSLTQTLINGHLVGSGDWLIINQLSNVGRSVTYALFPSEIVDQVVVHKGSQAKLVEGGASGTINILTRKPLDFGKGFTGEASLGGVYSDLPDRTEPQFSALLNWKNARNDLGLMLQTFVQHRSLRRDSQEVVGGYPQISATSPAALANPDLAGLYYPDLIGSALFTQKRERTGGMFDFQYKPADTLEFSLNGYYSKLEANNFNRNFMLRGNQFVPERVPDSFTVNNGVITDAIYPEVNGAPVLPYVTFDQISRIAGSKSSYITMDADWQVNDRVNAVFQLGTTRGNGETRRQDRLEQGLAGNAGASWSLGHHLSPVDWALVNDANVNSEDALDSFTRMVGFMGSNARDKEHWASADAELYLDRGIVSALEMGLRYADHVRRNDGVINQGLRLAELAGYPFPEAQRNYPGDFAGSIGGQFPRGSWYYTEAQLAAINAVLADRDPASRAYWQGAYRVKERNSAAYVQANFKGDAWSGNLGLRYVHTAGENHYNQSDITAAAGYVPVTVDNNYRRFLPSLNLRYELNDHLVGRFSASRTITRPDYSDLAGYVFVQDLTHTGNGGNPNLKPVTSSNLDLSLEWYFMPRGLLAVSVWQMDLKDFIAPQTLTVNYLDQSETNATGQDVFADYLMSMPANIDGKVKGVELTWEQPLGEYFGINANYTWADGETENGGPLLGTSKNTYNLSGYFEHDKFSARASYTRRSEFYYGPRRSYPFYLAALGTLSATLNYRFNDRFSLSLDGLNLNNPIYRYYTRIEGSALPYAIYENGRQYYLNLHVSF